MSKINIILILLVGLIAGCVEGENQRFNTDLSETAGIAEQGSADTISVAPSQGERMWILQCTLTCSQELVEGLNKMQSDSSITVTRVRTIYNRRGHLQAIEVWYRKK